MQYSVVKYNKLDHFFDLEYFCERAQKQNLINNASVEDLTRIHLFVTYYNGDIIGTSGCHDFSEHYENTWRVFSRTCTLKEYRLKGFPRRIGVCTCAGINVYSIPHQVNFALSQGAKNIVYTTNNDKNGYSGSLKLDIHHRKYVDKCPEYEYYDEKKIYGVKQTVWKLLYKDVVNMEGKL